MPPSRMMPAIKSPTISDTTVIVPLNILEKSSFPICLDARRDTAARRKTAEPRARRKCKIATIIKPMAGPFTCSCAAGLCAGIGAMVGGGPLGAAAANSGNSENSFHSVAPSGRTLVCALIRPSASHCRNCSALTGPYSFPSAPMILYMRGLCAETSALVKQPLCAGCDHTYRSATAAERESGGGLAALQKKKGRLLAVPPCADLQLESIFLLLVALL